MFELLRGIPFDENEEVQLKKIVSLNRVLVVMPPFVELLHSLNVFRSDGE